MSAIFLKAAVMQLLSSVQMILRQSVASIDDIDTAQYLIPSLTTAHIPLDEMGKMAAKILIDRIEGGHEKHLKILFPYDIIERKSTAAFRKIHGNPQK